MLILFSCGEKEIILEPYTDRLILKTDQYDFISGDALVSIGDEVLKKIKDNSLEGYDKMIIDFETAKINYIHQKSKYISSIDSLNNFVGRNYFEVWDPMVHKKDVIVGDMHIFATYFPDMDISVASRKNDDIIIRVCPGYCIDIITKNCSKLMKPKKI